ncbi:hypothetical protein [Candidatus Viridilinea mediisalina]|uniref:N-acetyltransferase domain-containing protein n=1 Tax=Candidatus Viridilinea mediisalina TaxID=2024553 RepID=A0A2A6RJU8_9CHLR|nr:hypothetical protein [Candidatus Viridilinea mediisalina]PDW03292.1 hypothetical protein CJ255_09605 [Candidatus Viridilinea mediisalina]
MVQPISALRDTDHAEMYALMERHFLAMSPAGFAADLAEKSAIILLREASSNQLVGFSTITQLESYDEHGPISAIFSGDTIVDRAHWGSPRLAQLWGRYVFARAAQMQPQRVYWFLICSGYKTYRFLPLFFREFYPHHAAPTPPSMQALMDRLAYLKFPEEYCAHQGIVRLQRATPLRPEVAPLTSARQRDPHIAFFARANPGHHAGDELVCLAELSHANLSAAGRRMLREGEGA